MSDSGASAEAGTTQQHHETDLNSVLASFQAWLATAPAAPPQLDFAELLRHFTALRHEVNLQTKASRAATEQLAQALQVMANPPKPPDPRESVRPLVRTLVEVADALRVAHQQLIRTGQHFGQLQAQLVELQESDWPAPPAARSSPAPSLLARLLGAPTTDDAPWSDWAERVQQFHADQLDQVEEIEDRIEQLRTGIADGYAMSLRRLERSLAAEGIVPIECLGQPFNPDTMEALELVEGEESGLVVEVVRLGYTWQGELFRTAQVKVAR